MPVRTSRWSRLLLVLACIGLAGCGSPTAEEPAAGGDATADQPTTEGDTGGDAGGDAGASPSAAGATAAAGSPIEALQAELEGLDDDARRERLLEIAQDEDGSLQFYTSMNSDQATPWLESFQTDTEVEVEYVRGSAGDILNRVLQEQDADYRGADVISNTGPEVLVLAREEICAPLQTPYTDRLLEGTVHERFAATGLNVFVPVWNGELVDAPPATWEEALETENLVMDPRDYQWFMTLVEGYLMADRGMTEEEAIAFVTEAVQGSATPVEGHSTGMELLAAGEFALHPSQYHHQTAIFDEASPIKWEPIVEPLIVQQNGVCIHTDTERPATAQLFVDWALSPEGQQLYADLGRDAASTALEESVLNGRETLHVDLGQTLDEQEKWESTFLEIMQGATS